jgi:two-component system cell cycle sensor histidine kinase/response regulator CckA
VVETESRASGIFSVGKAYMSRLKSTPKRAIRVLIVDDERALCELVDRVLSEAGYATTTAPGGAEAIEAAAKIGRLDLLVTDLMMPEMTGDELARRLRQSQPSLKVLYLTGFSDHLFKEKVTLWQDEAFLDKPCSIKGLREAVSLLLFGRFDDSKKLP